MSALTLGPIAIALPRAFLLISVLAAFLAIRLLLKDERRRIANDATWTGLMAGVLAARLAYVATHFAHYRAHPLEILHVWDGGYLPLVGFVAAVSAALWSAWRRGLWPRHVIAPVLIGAALWGALNAFQSAALRSAGPLPAELTLAQLHGAPRTLDEFAGKPLVLNLWATWCPPCRREMPVLAAAQRARPDVHFVFVNQREHAGVVARYLESEGLVLSNVLLDSSGELAASFRAPGLPTTLLFTADGRLLDVHMGELSAPALSDLLAELTGNTQ